jgi:hypothetical protein
MKKKTYHIALPDFPVSQINKINKLAKLDGRPACREISSLLCLGIKQRERFSDPSYLMANASAGTINLKKVTT